MGKSAWDDPLVYRDLLVAMCDHFSPSMAALGEIADVAKAAGGWQFTNGGL